MLEALREVLTGEREEETEPVVDEETAAAEVVTEGEPTLSDTGSPHPLRLPLLDAYPGRYRDRVVWWSTILALPGLCAKCWRCTPTAAGAARWLTIRKMPFWR